MRTVAGLVIALGLTAAALSPAGDSGPPPADRASPATVRLLFGGDVMLGRRVGRMAAVEGPELFEGLRPVVSGADLALANLESPLTSRAHLAATTNQLEADPALAPLLAGAGFDLMAVANNHAGDAGDDGLLDTMAALSTAGITPVGGGGSGAEAERAVTRSVHGVRVAFLAFDVTGLGPRAGPGRPGVAVYSTDAARRAVTEARTRADVVVVSVHGGVEYLLDPDPLMERVAAELSRWGADVIWGHGSHARQPVTVTTAGPGRRTLVATGLGNLLFDQQPPATRTGLVLEVLVGVDGVLAYRVGSVEHGELRPRFVGWDQPTGPAVLLGTGWWSLLSAEIGPERSVPIDGFPWGAVTAAAPGDVTGDGRQLLVVSYRRAYRPTLANQLFPEHPFADALGRSAHLGVFQPGTYEPVWGAGTMLAPVAALAVCDGAVALAFDRLDDPAIRATGAWVWWDFGFTAAELLPGAGDPACIDVDRDGRTDPVVAR